VKFDCFYGGRSIGAGALGIPAAAIRQTVEWFGRDVLPQFEEAS
jgi:hypothetical protein